VNIHTDPKPPTTPWPEVPSHVFAILVTLCKAHRKIVIPWPPPQNIDVTLPAAVGSKILVPEKPKPKPAPPRGTPQIIGMDVATATAKPQKLGADEARRFTLQSDLSEAAKPMAVMVYHEVRT